MKFEFHHDALAAFNEQANVVAESIACKLPVQKRMGARFRPDVHSSATLTKEDVLGPMQMSELDQSGDIASRYIDEAGVVVGYNVTAYAKLRKLAQSIQKTAGFSDVVSSKFVEDALFHWSLQKLKSKTNKTTCEYIACEAAEKVRVQEIWVPVYGLYVQSAFSVGRVTFRTITREMIEDWHGRIRAKAGSNPQVIFKLDRDKKKLLGFAAATSKIEAEPIRAKEIADDLAEKAISILRLFATANFDPQQFSYCVPLGSHQRYGHHNIAVQNGKIVEETQGITPKGQYPWVIDDLLLQEFNSTALLVFSGLFEKEPKNSLEKLVFDALLLYSKAAIVPTLAEKLLYMFAALESVLLRDENEPVTETIAERVAFLAEKEPDSRLAVRRSVKQAYGVRSRFVHHGRREDADLKPFFVNAWTALCNMTQSASKFKTKQELLDSLERYKYRS